MPGFITNRDTIAKITVTPEVRAACRVVYTASIDIYAVYNDLDVGDRILLVGQQNAAENGIYLVKADHSLRRAPDANTAERLKPGVMVAITEGDEAGSIYIQTSGKLGQEIVYTLASADTSELEGASHTHDNKALLDSYTQTETDLADAVTKRHEHTNKSYLDLVTGQNTGDQTATSTPFDPAGTEFDPASTTVQAALIEASEMGGDTIAPWAVTDEAEETQFLHVSEDGDVTIGDSEHFGGDTFESSTQQDVAGTTTTDGNLTWESAAGMLGGDDVVKDASNTAYTGAGPGGVLITETLPDDITATITLGQGVNTGTLAGVLGRFQSNGDGYGAIIEYDYDNGEWIFNIFAIVDAEGGPQALNIVTLLPQTIDAPQVGDTVSLSMETVDVGEPNERTILRGYFNGNLTYTGEDDRFATGKHGFVIRGDSIDAVEFVGDEFGSLTVAGNVSAQNISGNNTGDQDASTVPYDNTSSGLTASDVQSAIDSVHQSIPDDYIEKFPNDGGPGNAISPSGEGTAGLVVNPNQDSPDFDGDAIVIIGETGAGLYSAFRSNGRMVTGQAPLLFHENGQPFFVHSTSTKVDNLDADRLDGYEAEDLLTVKPNVVSGDYMLTLGDAGMAIEFDQASGDATLTVPPYSTAQFPVGTVIGVVLVGAGDAVNIAGFDSNVEILHTAKVNPKIVDQYAVATLRMTYPNGWILSGDLEPAAQQ